MFDYFEEEDRAHRERGKRWVDRRRERSRDLAEQRLEVERLIVQAKAAGDRAELTRLEAERERLAQQAATMTATAIGLAVWTLLVVIAVVFFL